MTDTNTGKGPLWKSQLTGLKQKVSLTMMI
jgi:hypothetical protein